MVFLVGSSAFLLKRPPYLIEFAGKRKNDALTEMMRRAEERFAELPSEADVVKHTYVVAPRIRWQGMVENPLPSFWSPLLSEVWAATEIEKPQPQKQPLFDEIDQILLAKEFPTKKLRGWLAVDPERRIAFPVLPEMEQRARIIEEHPL